MNTELRFLLAIALMVGVLVVTNVIFPPVPRPPAGLGPDSAAIVDPGPPTASELTPSPAPPALVPDTTTPAAAAVERRVVVEAPLYRHVFSTRGARLVSAELLAFRSFTREGPVQLIADTVA